MLILQKRGFISHIRLEQEFLKNKAVLEQNSLADEIRMQSYKSDYLDDKYMHIKQKELSDLLKSEINVVASAPTSFGKSLLIEEIVASGTYNNIIIIQQHWRCWMKLESN